MRHIRLMMDFLNYNIKIISKQDIINFLTKDAQIRLALRILVPIAEAGDKKADFWDALSGSGNVSAVEYTLSAFTVEAFFCSACKKMMIGTDIDK